MNIAGFLLLLFLFFPVAGIASQAASTSCSPLLISVKEAIEAKKNNSQALLIDVRREAAFNAIHIPDSINVPLHLIKTKSYLRNMYVILVNQGYAVSPLLRQAELLNGKGVQAVVLAGGLAAWSQQGKNFRGSDSADHAILYDVDPATLSAKEFVRYIDISPEKNAGDLSFLSGTESVPVSSSADLPALMQMIGGSGQSPLTSVLLFNRDGEYRLLEDLPEKCQSTLFFLRNGSEGYKKVVFQQQAILEPKSERIKTIGGCKTCPQIKDIMGRKKAGEPK